MEKVVGIKIEGRTPYDYYHSSYSVEEVLNKLVNNLKEGQAIVIKCGRERHYIDYDKDGGYNWLIKEYMYYVKERLGRW